LANNNLCPQSLLDYLQTLPETKHYWVGYSGGVDSHVLLHLLTSIRNKIHSTVTAVHINHGISKNSDIWSEYCKQVCDHFDVTFKHIKINADCPDGDSLENWARQQRYAAFAELVRQNDILLTAHNRDDQAETVLLQLLRGSGPRGLSAMPVVKQISKGLLARPLLNYSRKEILDYANNVDLKWIDDETNDDIKYDRNYLRQIVIPVLEERWPSFSQVVSRSARHQSEILQILDEIAVVVLVKKTGFPIA
jgi:tRNA(Ile)-lysidine synthase